ncbi:MAG: glycerophosphodiester phosphodiesterase [Pusillimonas sp.]
MMQPSTDWPYPALIAHRGAGRHAPENTLAAMRLGARHGFMMMEYDVKLSRDGVALLLHDDTLDRTSNGTGNAADKTWTELAAVDAGAWHSAEYAGEPIPALHAIAAFTRAHGIHSNIEIKPHTGLEAETGKQVARLARGLWAGAALPPLLSSFSEAALEAALREAPELPRALLIAKEVPEDWRNRARRLECKGLNLNHRYTSRDIVRDIRGAGYTLAIWTVNDSARARELLDWGCNAIVTDEIKVIAPGKLA